METPRKIIVEISPELPDRAQRASGEGITQTVRTGRQLVAARQAYTFSSYEVPKAARFLEPSLQQT